MNIVKLSSGYEAQVRPVPPTSYLDVELSFSRNHPPPKRPTVKLHGRAGNVEEVAASMDAPEWAEYEHAKDIRGQELFHAQMDFAYNYAVLAWRKIGDEEWSTQPPSDWRPDELIPDTDSPRRVVFVKYVLIQSGADDKAVNNPAAIAPLEESEVAAALDTFQPETEREPAPARAGKRKGHNG